MGPIRLLTQIREAEMQVARRRASLVGPSRLGAFPRTDSILSLHRGIRRDEDLDGVQFVSQADRSGERFAH